MLCGQKHFEFELQKGGLAWLLATNTSSHTAGGASRGSPKVFIFVCVRRKKKNKKQHKNPGKKLPVTIPPSVITLEATGYY